VAQCQLPGSLCPGLGIKFYLLLYLYLPSFVKLLYYELWLFTRRKCLTFLNRALSLWFLFYLIPILCNYVSIYLLYIIYYIYQGRPNGRSQTISKLIVLEFIFRLRTRKLIMMVVNTIKLFYGNRSSKMKYIFSRSWPKKLWPPLIYMVFY